MNLKKIKDSQDQGQFQVGNVNDYVNIIAETNVLENTNLTVEDFESLESEFKGKRLSYKVMSYKDNEALRSFDVNGSLFLNIYV